MPLSEDEQRVLQDIERSFYENDPAFARAVTNNGFDHASRNCKLAAMCFVLCLVAMLFTFAHYPVAGFVGFLGMVVSAALFVQNLRRIIRPRLNDVADIKGKFRDRFNGG